MNAAPPAEKTHRISNPERVQRILMRVADSGLPLIIRLMKSQDTAVKGRATKLVQDGAVKGLRISNISEHGLQHIVTDTKEPLQVEFVFTSAKLVFPTSLISSDGQSILVSLPTFLLSIERRKNARFPVTDDLMAFLRLPTWIPEAADPTVLPFFECHRESASRFFLADISLGGVCVVARFPALSAVLKKGAISDQLELLLPLTEAVDVSVEVRWKKRIRDLVSDTAGQSRSRRVFKFGLEFVNLSEEAASIIQRYIQRLSQAQAI